MKKFIYIILALTLCADALLYARGGHGGGGRGRGSHSGRSHSSNRGHGGHGGRGYHGGYRGGYRGGFGAGFGWGFFGGMIGGMAIASIAASSYRGQPAYNVTTQQGPTVVIVERNGEPYVVQDDELVSWYDAYPNDPAPDMNQLRSAANNGQYARSPRQDRLARIEEDIRELRAEERALYYE